MDTVEWREWLDRMSEDQVVDKWREFEDKLAAAHKLVREMGEIVQWAANHRCRLDPRAMISSPYHKAQRILSRPEVVKVMKEGNDG